ILFASQLAASSCDSKVIKGVWEECLRLAVYMASHPPTNDNERGIIQALTVSLADAAMRLSGSYDGRKVGLQLFVQKLVDVARRWPAFAKYNGPALIQGLN